MRKATILVVALLASACHAARLPASGAFGGGAGSTPSSEAAAVKGLVRQAAKQYKHVAPLIGILTQPCTDCPGK